MTQTSGGKQQSAFSQWLRTGRLPSVGASEGVEFKFNPWHDPQDGRFTFAGAGNYHGPGGAGPAYRAARNPARDQPPKPRIATRLEAQAQSTAQTTRSGEKPADRGATGGRPGHDASQLGGKPNRAAEFVGGVGEGLYDVARSTAEAAYAGLTTNPVTTVRDVSRGIAGMIDGVIAAEDTPARIQVLRAADSVANASARQIGRATGSLVGSVALTAAPGAALGKVSALRRLRGTPPRISYDPPQIGWVKENLGPEKEWTRYNDAAPGARPGQAPTLT